MNGSEADIKVIILGSSVDPMTLAHLKIIEALSKQFPDDEIWIVPVYKHPDPKALASYQDRCEMAQEVINNQQEKGALQNVCVSTIEETVYHDIITEISLDTVRTYRLLDYLIHKEMGTTFSFVFGGDTLKALLAGNWSNGQSVIRQCERIIYVDRPGHELKTIESSNYEIQQAITSSPKGKFIPIKVFDETDELLKNVSSTAFRELTNINLAHPDKTIPLEKIVPPEVLVHAYSKKLYGFSDDFCSKETVIDWYKARNTAAVDEKAIDLEIKRRQQVQPIAKKSLENLMLNRIDVSKNSAQTSSRISPP